VHARQKGKEGKSVVLGAHSLWQTSFWILVNKDIMGSAPAKGRCRLQ